MHLQRENQFRSYSLLAAIYQNTLHDASSHVTMRQEVGFPQFHRIWNQITITMPSYLAFCGQNTALVRASRGHPCLYLFCLHKEYLLRAQNLKSHPQAQSWYPKAVKL
jgi:hypothetical protein